MIITIEIQISIPSNSQNIYSNKVIVNQIILSCDLIENEFTFESLRYSFEALVKNLKLKIFDHFLFYIYIFGVVQTLYIQSIHITIYFSLTTYFSCFARIHYKKKANAFHSFFKTGNKS